MTHTLTRANIQSSPISHPTNNLDQLINFDPILSEYFKNACIPPRYYQLAYELMLDGLRYRTNNQHSQPNSRNCCCNQIKNTSPPKDTHVPKPILKENKNQKNQGSNSIDKKIHKTLSGQKDKHQNVSYVKHQRFLSPSQKKQLVTPKITEIIPGKTVPLVIYGKPRVKIDEQCGCPYHNNEEQCLRSIPYGGPCQPRQMPVRIVHVKQGPYQNRQSNYNYQNMRPETGRQNNLMRYNSTPNINSKYDRQANEEVVNLQKTTKLKNQRNKTNNLQATSTPFKKKKGQNKEIQSTHMAAEQGNIIYVDRIVEVQSRVPGQMRIVKSPKTKIIHEEHSVSEQDYSYLDAKYNEGGKKLGKKQIESKIKFLIERDKKSKEMEKNLKKQEQKIRFLEKMMKQDQKGGVDLKKTKVIEQAHHFTRAMPSFHISEQSRESLSLSSSQNSDMSMLDSQVVRKYRSKVVKGGETGNKRGSRVAHFGVGQQTEKDESCFCENSFNEESQEQDMEYKQTEIKIKQSRESSSSLSDYQP